MKIIYYSNLLIRLRFLGLLAATLAADILPKWRLVEGPLGVLQGLQGVLQGVIVGPHGIEQNRAL